MANLNRHDVLFLNSPEFAGFTQKLEDEYGFKLLSYDLPDFVSFTSRKAVIHTNKGTFFLKEKPEYCSEEKQRRNAARFQNHISDYLNTVPRIVSTKNSEFYIEWGRRFLFISEYKPGRIFNGTRKDIRSMMKSLKAFQAVAQDFKPSGDARTESYELLIPLDLVQKFATSEAEKHDFLVVEEVFNTLKQEYLGLDRSSYVMSHGDFSLFNMLFDDKRVVTITDFDNAQTLPRIQDMAEFLISATLVNYLAPLSNLKYPVFLRPDFSKLKLILDTYKKEFSLNSTEKEVLPVLAEMVWLDILLLATLKEDYSITRIMPAVMLIKEGYLRSEIKTILNKSTGSFFTFPKLRLSKMV